VTVFLAWASDLPEELFAELAGPWREVRRVAPGLALVDSPETLSRVYHELKWQLAEDASLFVTAVEHTPKSRGMAAGTTSWLRRRLTPASTEPPQ
jgi:hypothetical protein